MVHHSAAADGFNRDRLAGFIIRAFHPDAIAGKLLRLFLIAELIGHLVGAIVEYILTAALDAQLRALTRVCSGQLVVSLHSMFLLHFRMAAHLRASAVHHVSTERL